MVIIRNYDDFVNALLEAGFSMGGGNSEGIYAVVPWSWKEPPPYDTPVWWHTGDPETDPWEWRIRVVEERRDIAYAKLFFRKGGYITRRWYPYFLAARRPGGRSLMEEYLDGRVSHFARRVYEVIAEHEPIPLHEIKYLGGLSREDAFRFDAALVELQAKMFVTICGQQRKVSQKGEAYGWSSTVFCTVERFFGPEILEEAAELDRDEAFEEIKRQIHRLNPGADPKKVRKFILG